MDNLIREDDTAVVIDPGSPWENGYCESFNSKLRDELLAAEASSTLHEAKVLDEHWHINTMRSGRTLRWDTGHRRPGRIPI
jgi:transposase InsO family protein